MKKDEEVDDAPGETDPLLQKAKAELQTWRQRVHEFWEENVYVNWFVMACIMCSCVAFCVQTIHAYEDYRVFMVMETVFIVVFTTELVCRAWSFPGAVTDFWSTPMNVIDFLAIAPFFVELLLMAHEYDLRVLRVLRLVRLFKFGRHSEQLNMIGTCLLLSASSFFLLAFMLVLALIVFSSLMHVVERGSEWDKKNGCYLRYDGLCSPFQSIPMTFWWAITTMTTVGYGDTFPITELGKVVGALTMIIGLLCVALPTTVLGVQFSSAHDELSLQREIKKLKQRIPDTAMQEEMRENVAAVQQVSRELNVLIPDLKKILIKVAEKNGRGAVDPTFTFFADAALQSAQKLAEFSNLESAVTTPRRP